jgi:Lysozyme like domain
MADIRTPIGDAPILPISLLVAGGYLAWFGVHYWRSANVKWPTDPVKAVLTGQAVPANTPSTTAADALTADFAGSGGPGTGDTEGQDPTPIPGSGGVLNHAQLQALWVANGGSPSTANVGAAIAQAESSGRVDVESGNPDGGTNVGLWQLDTNGKGAGHTVAQLQDPNTNARLAVMGSANGTNWSAWATFGSGAYKQFLA